MALSIVLIPVLIDTLGSEQYGLFVLSSTILGYFTILNLGLPGAATKHIAEYSKENNDYKIAEIFKVTNYLYIGIAILISGSVILSINCGILNYFNITNENLALGEQILYIAGVFALVVWPLSTITVALAGYQQYQYMNYINFFTSVANFTLVYYLAKNEYSLVVIFVSTQVLGIIKQLVLLLRLQSFLPLQLLFKVQPTKATLRKLINFSVWMLLPEISVLFAYQADRLIIGAILSVSAITAYQIISRPFELLKTLSWTLRIAIMPNASARLNLRDNSSIRNYYFRITAYFNNVISCVAVVSFLFVEPFILIWVGDKFIEYIFMIKFLMLFIVFSQMTAPLGQIMQGVGYVKTPGLISTLLSFVNLIISILLTKQFGIYGVFIGTIAMGMLLQFMTFNIFFPRFGIPIRAFLLNCFLKPVLPPFLILGAILLINPTFNSFVTGWWKLFGWSFLSLLATITISYLMFYDKVEVKKILRSVIGAT